MKRHIVRAPGTDRYVIDVLEASDIPSASPPTPGIIPVGTVLLFTFSGTNTANALRHMNPDSLAADIAPNTGEIRIPMPFAGKLMNLIVSITPGLPNQPPPAHTSFTLRKNGVGNDPSQDTIMKVDLTMIGSNGGTSPGPVDVVAGDLIGVNYYPISEGGAMTSGAWAHFFLVKT